MSRDLQRNFTRRRWLESSAMGFGSLALATLLNDNPLRGNEAPSTLFNDLKPRSGHFPGKAKAVIQLFQTGGASQMDLFDPKPELIKRNGQPVPSSIETFQAGNANICSDQCLSSKSEANAGWKYPMYCRNCRASRMTCAWCVPCSPSTITIPRGTTRRRRAKCSRGAHRPARGSLMRLAPRIRIFRLTSCCATLPAALTKQIGQAVGCLPFIKAWSSTRKERRYIIWNQRFPCLLACSKTVLA